jgi:hypothetical protein
VKAEDTSERVVDEVSRISSGKEGGEIRQAYNSSDIHVLREGDIVSKSMRATAKTWE